MVCSEHLGLQRVARESIATVVSLQLCRYRAAQDPLLHLRRCAQGKPSYKVSLWLFVVLWLVVVFFCSFVSYWNSCNTICLQRIRLLSQANIRTNDSLTADYRWEQRCLVNFSICKMTITVALGSSQSEDMNKMLPSF